MALVWEWAMDTVTDLCSVLTMVMEAIIQTMAIIMEMSSLLVKDKVFHTDSVYHVQLL